MFADFKHYYLFYVKKNLRNEFPEAGKGTMGWCHGFKLHLMYNDEGDIITFCLTGANVDDRDDRVWNVFRKVFYGKVFANIVHSRTGRRTTSS